MPTDLPEPTTDVTETEISDGLPGSLVDRVRSPSYPGRAEDHTAFVDPVEQAILVDRTRARHRSRHAPVGPSAAATRGDLTGLTRDATAIDVRSTSEEPGDGMFGQYRVVAPLAGGSSATLLLAEHCTLGFPVAIKVLQPALVGSPEAENRFFAEATLAARIGHPGIPMALDFGYDQRGIAYLAMEYLEGETLGAHLDGGSLFSLDQVLEIGAQTAAIVAAAHACGVAHGGLSTDRIHICPDAAEPSGLRVKVLDFGPHATEPASAGDALADVHGLGCVLYRLLAGRPPADGDAQALETQDPPPPRAHRADIPPPLDALVHRMVAHRPHDRPGSMAEVDHQLRTLLVGHQLVDAAPAAGSLSWRVQSLRSLWASARPVVEARWREAVDFVRQLSVRYPRGSVAVLASALFVATILLILLVS